MHHTSKATASRGISIIEVVIVTFVATTVLFSVMELAAMSRRAASEKRMELQGIYYLDEGVEALRAMRDESWNTRIETLTASTTYYFVPTASAWVLTPTNPGSLDGVYLRSAIMHDVTRNPSDDIVTGSGTNDPDTKQFTVTVTWAAPSGVRSITNDIYLANLWQN